MELDRIMLNNIIFSKRKWGLWIFFQMWSIKGRRSKEQVSVSSGEIYMSILYVVMKML